MRFKEATRLDDLRQADLHALLTARLRLLY
jgi:hypothetical protein